MERTATAPEFREGDSGDETKTDPARTKPQRPDTNPLYRLNNVPQGEFPEPNG